MKELKFRSLRAEEIELRISNVSENGVTLLAYKDARCDQNILDEVIGPLNWQREHSRDNANCTVSIWDEDKSLWVKKEDTGKESFAEAEKGLASDSFKRACFNWGIGRSLYTCPPLFIFKDKLTKLYKKDEKKWACNNIFKCSEITYSDDERYVISITVDVYEYNTKKYTVTFRNDNKASGENTFKASEKQNIAKETPKNNANANNVNTNNAAVPASITDDTIILMGNCRGETYGRAKGTPKFISFLKWAANSTTQYTGETQAQFLVFKEMGKKL